MSAATLTPPAEAAADPLGYLSKCHILIVKSIEEILNVLDWTHGGMLNRTEERNLVCALERLNRAIRLHGMDEEDSLQPRLESCDNPDVRSTAPILASIIEQTRAAEELHIKVDATVRKWLYQRSLTFLEVWALRDQLVELLDAYRQHASKEEVNVFAVAEKGLCEHCRHEITSEMLWRRGLA